MTRSSKLSRNTFSTSEMDFLNKIVASVDSFQSDLKKILIEYDLRPKPEIENVEQTVINIFERFHIVALALSKQYDNRQAFEIQDEKDVQHLLHALLRLYFEDIRPEEPTASMAGSYSLIDFILKREKIGIEVKMAYKGHSNKRIKEELILDKDNYRRNTDCKKLLCMIYDPKGIIKNPRGFEDDLSDDISGLETKVFVVPRF